MTLLNKIDKRIQEIYAMLESKKITETELIEKIRSEENNESSLLFYFFIERILLISMKNNKIIISKALLKHYLNSNFKEHGDYLFYGKELNESVEKINEEVYLKKGIFIQIIEKLNLTKTKKIHVDFLLSSDSEFENIINRKISIDEVISVLFKEIDNKNFKDIIFTF